MYFLNNICCFSSLAGGNQTRPEEDARPWVGSTDPVPINMYCGKAELCVFFGFLFFPFKTHSSRISNWNTLDTNITTTQPSHTMYIIILTLNLQTRIMELAGATYSSAGSRAHARARARRRILGSICKQRP